MRPAAVPGRFSVIGSPRIGDAMASEHEETIPELLQRVDEALAENEKLAADTEALVRRAKAEPLSKRIASDDNAGEDR